MHNNTSDSDSSDDNSSNSDEIDEALIGNSRLKRSTCWCRSTPNNSQIVWPPPASTSTTNWRQLRHVPFGNPLFGTKMQLYSKTNNHLAVYPDNKIRGTPDENDLHTYLELLSAGHSGHVRIKGLLTNLYVAMDHKGRLYGESDMNNESTVFIESFQGSYSTFLSRKYAHLGWYIGIKKSGRIKRGPKTAYGQKAIRFLPRRSKFQ